MVRVILGITFTAPFSQCVSKVTVSSSIDIISERVAKMVVEICICPCCRCMDISTWFNHQQFFKNGPCCCADLTRVSDVSSNDFLVRYVVCSDYHLPLLF